MYWMLAKATFWLVCTVYIFAILKKKKRERERERNHNHDCIHSHQRPCFLYTNSIQIYYTFKNQKLILKNELRGYWILAREIGFTSRINVHYYLTVFTKPCCDIWSLVSIYISKNPHPKLLWNWKKKCSEFCLHIETDSFALFRFSHFCPSLTPKEPNYRNEITRKFKLTPHLCTPESTPCLA